MLKTSGPQKASYIKIKYKKSKGFINKEKIFSYLLKKNMGDVKNLLI